MGRAIPVYTPAFSQGDIAFHMLALKRYNPDLRLVYIAISPSQTVYIMLIYMHVIRQFMQSDIQFIR